MGKIKYFFVRVRYCILPILIIGMLAFVNNVFSINKKIINKDCLWDMVGRPYKTFLNELNLPHSAGAIFIGGTPDNVVKIEKYYKKINTGDIFTSQLRSFLFGTKITEFSIASYINFVFGISAILFSLLTGYFIFKNGYISILIFLSIVIFRNFCQGLIYGLPLRHAYAVFNPLLIFCIIIFINMFLKNSSKKYWISFILSGFIIAYIEYCRTSEGQIIIMSLSIFTMMMLLEHLIAQRKDIKEALRNILTMFIIIYVGYFGYQRMILTFEHHRDKKFNFPFNQEKILSRQPAFHTLYISLFRYDIPNKFGDKIGYDAVFERYPELKKKFLADVDYFELANSQEYNSAIRKLYFYFILNNPKHFFTYLFKSIYDYFLFLPYYSWTGNKSAHAYLPKINKNVIIEPQDLAPDFKDTPLNWIVNLRLKYLPKNILFWIYFICGYILLIEAICSSFSKKLRQNNSPIYLLWGMLIYFFFASIIRILIPMHGQSAVVAFNIIIIYNLIRIAVFTGSVGIKSLKIPIWLLLLLTLSIFFPIAKSLYSFQISRDNSTNLAQNSNFDINTDGWTPYLTTLSSVENGQKGNCLKITASEDATGYAYCAIPTSPGQIYKISAFYKKINEEADGQIKVGASIDDTSLYYSGILSDADWTRYGGLFKATSSTTYITLVNLTSTKGQTSYFDSVTVTEYEYYSE